MDIQVQSFAVTNLRRRPVVVETGGFVAGFTPGTDNPYLNYATPLPGAKPTEQDVAALIGIFRERGLLPRLEFAPQAAPAVAPALRAAGFGTEAVHAYLVCTPRTLTLPRSAGSPHVESPTTVHNSIGDVSGTSVQASDFSGDVGGTIVKSSHGTVHTGSGSVYNNSRHVSGDRYISGTGTTYTEGDHHGDVHQRFGEPARPQDDRR
ncbi:GNAT family N-acetyltransferase [Streptomyces tricolor]|uniref:GNAT family N-acetyltransferase n=1 Tax=Streptomyces tricolor TaxID=68277 RepID=UPI0037F5287A